MCAPHTAHCCPYTLKASRVCVPVQVNGTSCTSLPLLVFAHVCPWRHTHWMPNFVFTLLYGTAARHIDATHDGCSVTRGSRRLDKPDCPSSVERIERCSGTFERRLSSLRRNVLGCGSVYCGLEGLSLVCFTQDATRVVSLWLLRLLRDPTCRHDQGGNAEESSVHHAFVNFQET